MVAGAWSRRGSSRTSCSLAAHGTKQNKTEETVVSACCEKNRLQCLAITAPWFVHVDAHVRLVDTNTMRLPLLYLAELCTCTDRRVPTTQQPVDTTRCLLISHCY
jgi:hypothetical protein